METEESSIEVLMLTWILMRMLEKEQVKAISPKACRLC